MEYARKKQPLTQREVRQTQTVVQGQGMSNSDLLSAYGIEDAPSADLGRIMQERMQAQFMDNQNPAAEAEADRLSAGISRGLDEQGVRDSLGSRLGADFSGVRFHTDGAAARQADAIGARAYTTGRDIYFGSEGFDPAVAAHEMVHTVQQGTVASGTPTTAMAAGTVQMIPKWLRTLGGGLKTAGVGIKEYIGGIIAKRLKIKKPDSEENARKAQNGDLSMFSRMAKRDQAAIVEREKAGLQQTIGEAGTGDQSVYNAVLAGNSGTSQMLNPAFRRALSEMSHSSQTPENQRTQLAEAGERMDQLMFINTMKKHSQAQKDALKSHYKGYGDVKRLKKEYDLSSNGKTYLGEEGESIVEKQDRRDEINRLSQQISNDPTTSRSDNEAQTMADADVTKSGASGDAMLRLMFLMQLGKMSKVEGEKKEKRKSDWDKTMANAFSHGNRVRFDMAASGEDGSMDALRNKIFKEESGIQTRSAATHYLDKDMKEKRSKRAAIRAKFSSHYRHFGMDMAIGGAGNGGVVGEGGQAQMITQDGRSGHLYVGQRDSDKKNKGGFLIGMENDSPYRMSQTGHMHTAAADADGGSPTGALKDDAVGNKTNGRIVDLSHLSHEEVGGLVNRFSDHFSGLKGQEDQTQYNALLEQMTGKHMSSEAMGQLLQTLGYGADDELVRKILGGRG